MRINIIQPTMSRYQAPGLLGSLMQPVQNTAYLLAALVPDGHQVRVTDELVQPAHPETDDADLVAITFVTPFAPHAYRLARRYRARGTRVVLGGPHVTLAPAEAAAHADAVVLGEADDTWPECVRDAARGKLRQLYRAPHAVDTSRIPPSRHDLVSKKFLLPRSLQASRGCPFTCEYCSLPGFYGKGYRPRPVRAVVEEVEALDYRPGAPPIVFWDDNIVGNHVWAKKLFRELAPLRIRWLSQATITIAEDEELTELAGRAGCVGLFCGLESFSQASLAGVHKAFNRVRDYKWKLRRLHDHGIAITAGMVFGFDEDTPDIFDASVEAAEEIALDGASIGVLVPFPGTPLHARFAREGRILSEDLELYDGEHVVISPKRMSPEQLDEGMRRTRRHFYSARSIVRRMWRSRTQPAIVGAMNLASFFIAQSGEVSPGIPRESAVSTADMDSPARAAPAEESPVDGKPHRAHLPMYRA